MIRAIHPSCIINEVNLEKCFNLITNKNNTLSRKYFREGVLEKALSDNEVIEKILNYIFKEKDSVIFFLKKKKKLKLN